MIEKDESAILSIYLRDLAEQAYTTFAEEVRVHAAAAGSHRGVSEATPTSRCAPSVSPGSARWA